jgi:hypothetical protein
VRYLPAAAPAGGDARTRLTVGYPDSTRASSLGDMSDFDAVLERLLSEPAFAAALAADPGAALSGYRLDAGEVELLRSQASPDSGGGLAAVETRTNKLSTFGLFSAVVDIGHTLSAESTRDAAAGSWSAAGSEAGAAARHVTDAIGAHGATQGFGDAPDAGGSAGGAAGRPWLPPAHSGFGSAPDHAAGAGRDGLPAASSGFGDAPTTGLEEAGRSLGGAVHILPPNGYHPHIDANGDGHWDKATFVGTQGHGVEIFVDVNHDGHADFVGHDTNSDGLVDYADYDKDDNGTFEKRMYDDNGDGWLDRTVWHKNG